MTVSLKKTKKKTDERIPFISATQNAQGPDDTQLPTVEAN